MDFHTRQDPPSRCGLQHLGEINRRMSNRNIQDFQIIGIPAVRCNRKQFAFNESRQTVKFFIFFRSPQFSEIVRITRIFGLQIFFENRFAFRAVVPEKFIIFGIPPFPGVHGADIDSDHPRSIFRFGDPIEKFAQKPPRIFLPAVKIIGPVLVAVMRFAFPFGRAVGTHQKGIRIFFIVTGIGKGDP